MSGVQAPLALVPLAGGSLVPKRGRVPGASSP